MMGKQIDVLLSLNKSVNFTESNSQHPGRETDENQSSFGYILLSTIVVFLIGMVIARMTDKRNNRAVCRVLLPIQSFFQRLEWYELGVQTGSYLFSGTTSNVFIRFICDNGTSPVYWLQDPTKSNHTIFMTNGIAYFFVPLPKHIGKPFGIHIWHDETGEWPTWFLKSVTIRNILDEVDDVIVFGMKRWLSTSHAKSKPYAHVSLRNSTDHKFEIQSTSRVSQSYRMLDISIKEYHMWIGIFTSNPLSRFSKQRRAIFCLFSVLLISAISIFISKHNFMLLVGSKNDLACIEGICLSNHHIFVAAQAVFISLFPRIICCIVFERAENDIQEEEPASQRVNAVNYDVKKQGRYRRRIDVKDKRKRNHDERLTNHRRLNDGEVRSGNEKQKSPAGKRHTYSNSIHFIHNNVTRKCYPKLIKRRPKSLPNIMAASVDLGKLPIVPENSVMNFKTEDHLLPEFPDIFTKSPQRKDFLTNKFGRIFSVILLMCSAVLAFYMWSESRFWNNLYDKDSLKIVAVAILLDICIVQFLRPIFEYIRFFVINQKVTYDLFGCPLSSIRNVFIHVESRWRSVHSSEIRMQYLSKIYNNGIYIPPSRTLSSKTKSPIPRRLVIKDLIFSLMFLTVFTIHVWQRIDPNERILYQNMQEELIKWNDSDSVGVEWMRAHLLQLSHQNNSTTGEGNVVLNSLTIQQRRFQKDICLDEKLHESGFSSCILDLTNNNEDKSSYQFNWNASINETLETTDVTKIDPASDMLWQYRYHLNAHCDWTRKLLGIEVLESGYEFVLSKNTTSTNKQISLLISSSWLDDRTYEIITNGIFLYPQSRIIVICHSSFRRFRKYNKDIFIINGKKSTWSTWLCRAILSMSCITWMFNSVKSHTRSRLPFALLIILMFIVEFMQEVAFEKAFYNLRIDGNNRDFCKAVLYGKLLKILQVIGTFLMAFRIIQLLAFMKASQQIANCFKIVARISISIHFLQVLAALVLGHAIYIAQYNTERDFTNVLTALIVLIISPGRYASQFSIMQSSDKASCLLVSVVLASVKLTLIAALLSELQCNICIKRKDKKVEERVEMTSKKQPKMRDEISMDFTDTKTSKKKANKLISKNEENKTKSGRKIHSNNNDCQQEFQAHRANKHSNCLSSKITQISTYINENYLEAVAWDIFLVSLSFCFEKFKSLQGNVRPFESQGGKQKLSTFKGMRGKINSDHFKLVGIGGLACKQPLPQIKIRKEMNDKAYWKNARRDALTVVNKIEQ